jgi:hypothetical protein
MDYPKAKEKLQVSMDKVQRIYKNSAVPMKEILGK